MSLSTPSSNALEQLVRSACADLGKRLRAGEDCSAEEYLTRHPQIAESAETALEVIYTEYVVRVELNQSVSSDDWFVRFPQWKSDLQQLLQVHAQVVQDEVEHASRSRHDALSGSRSSRPLAQSLASSSEGKVVGGYQILEEIGRGGMGVVYRARQLKLNRDVALKMVLSGEFASPRELARFQTEAEAAARLQHPHIVQIHEIGAHDGRAFLSMELVEGGALDAKLRAARLEPRAAAELIETLARALQFAHEHGVVHRDLKPSNVLLDRHGVPKIADFGLAKQLADGRREQTRTGAAVGTPSYMAPEQATGKSAEVGPATDVYGLGVILYESLTGRPPLTGDTPLDTLRRVANDEPTPPSRIRSAVPSDLETICLKCLEKEPRRRYASAAALAEDLRRFLAHEPILAKPAGWSDRLRKFARRRPDLAALATLLAVAFVAVSTLWGLAEKSRRDAETSAERARRQSEVAERETRISQEERAKSERSLYFRRIGQAYGEIAANQVARANQLLDGARPEMRDWEWHYLKTLATSELRSRAINVDSIWSVAFHPSGRRVVAGTGQWGVGAAGRVFVWNLDGEPEFNPPLDQHGAVMDLEYSPDGERLAVAGKRWEGFPLGGVKLWPAKGGMPLELPPPGDDAFAVTYSRDGKRVATAGWDGVVRVWDATDGRLEMQLSGHGGNAFSLAFHPSDETLASAGRDGTVRLWDLKTRKSARPPLTGYGDVRRVAFSPDGRYLAFSTYSNNLRIWELSKPAEVILKHSYDVGVITDFAYSPEGRRIGLAGTNGSVLIIDAESGYELKRFRTSGGIVRGLAFHPDGRQLVTGGMDRTMKLWDARTDFDEQRLRPTRFAKCGEFRRLKVTPDGLRLLLPNSLNRTRYNVGEPTLLVWNVKQSKVERILRGHADWLTDVDVSPDGRFYATASKDGTARLWDAATGQEAKKLTHERSVENVAFDPFGRLLATSDAAAIVRLWNFDSGELLRTIRTEHEQIRRLAFHPTNGLLAVAGDRPSLKLWNCDTGEVDVTLDQRFGGANGVTFSGDGRWLATAGEGDAAFLWDWEQGTLKRTLNGHLGNVRDVAFSPSNQRLATAGADLSVKIWDIESDDEILTLRSSDPIASVAFHPDGKTLYAPQDWNVTTWSSERPDSRLLDDAFDDANLYWHETQGALALKEGRIRSSAFHYDRLVRLKAEQLTRRAKEAELERAAADATDDTK